MSVKSQRIKDTFQNEPYFFALKLEAFQMASELKSGTFSEVYLLTKTELN